MADNLYGWELLWSLVKNDVKKKEDVILLLIHHSLLKSDFKCAGLSENWVKFYNNLFIMLYALLQRH